MGTNPSAFGAGSQKVADTGPAGFALQNGTPAIPVSWTAPNDGQVHRATIICGLHITSPETGGAVQANTTLPDGTAANPQLFAGGGAAGVFAVSADRLVQAGSTVTLTQTSALSAGAALLWAQIWGA
jgi:hypothetical protein